MRNAGLRAVAAGCAAGMLAVIAATPSPAYAISNEELLERLQSVEQEVKNLRQELKKKEGVEKELDAVKSQLKKTEGMAEELQDVKSELAKTQQKAEQASQQAQKSAQEADNAYGKFHLGGYANTGFVASTSDDVTDSFLQGQFSPVFLYNYRDLLLFEGELELTGATDGTSGTDLSLEYASLDLLVNDNITLVAGKFLSPIGQFRERLHPSWINKLPDPPPGFGHGGVDPISEVGVMVRGGFQANPLFNYAFFVGNGPRIEFEDGATEGLELEGFGMDDNANKAVGGRVGVLPIPHLEVGASFLTSRMRGMAEDGVSGPVTDARYFLWGADASYTDGPLDVRFEGLWSRLGSFFSQHEGDEMETGFVPATNWEAWYTQLAYQLSGLTDTPILRNFEPVVRYGEVDATGFAHFVEHTMPEHRLTGGINYLFAPSVIAKASVSRRNFTEPGMEDATEGRLQFTYGF